ncbi:MAG: hypothetical protein A3F11_11210 [Gammaproteobacteria bacterium RIFCSPHIGHO2_12_FULL_37_14]|nr:MAG: hypothetical protein A3F11_11210 [Gammaproteobacteria bacterium RIFCSPHIGHO2_12_FULL_37_14]
MPVRIPAAPIQALHADRILLKLSGEIFLDKNELSIKLVDSIAKQILKLQDKFYFAIVIGGGNFFRGSKDSQALNLSPAYGHYVGMLATVMNGLILSDCFQKNNLDCKMLSALPSPFICETLSQNEIENSIAQNKTIIFSGGNGTPYFSTDTTAVVRALQFGAKEVWKCTTTDGIYDKDPALYKNAKFYSKITYKEALDQRLKIMDFSAFSLAQEHSLKIRVFNIFEKNSLIKMADSMISDKFGTTVY